MRIKCGLNADSPHLSAKNADTCGQNADTCGHMRTKKMYLSKGNLCTNSKLLTLFKSINFEKINPARYPYVHLRSTCTFQIICPMPEAASNLQIYSGVFTFDLSTKESKNTKLSLECER
jgi:hypothetical protein